jgi:hypothetical protein
MDDKNLGRHSPGALDAATKARIRAEEAERLRVRAELEAEAAGQVAAPVEPAVSLEKPAPAPRPAPEMKSGKFYLTAPKSPDAASAAPAAIQGTTADAWKGFLSLALIVVVGFFLIRACTSAIGNAFTPSPAQAAQNAEDKHWNDFGAACMVAGDSQLRSPASAHYSNYIIGHDTGTLSGTYQGGYTWRGYVDAQNAFGANIRTNFVCTADPNSDVVHMKFAGGSN